MATQVGICNRALGLLGANTIVSIDDGTVEANACQNMYESSLKSLLSEYPWNFATKRVLLAQLVTTPAWTDDGYSIEYQYPTDCLRVLGKSDTAAKMTIEGDKILSDTAALGIKYTFFNEDTSQYFSKFVDALANRLAIDICYQITNNATLKQSLITEYYDVILTAAMSAESQEGDPLEPEQSYWLDARYAGADGNA